MVATRAKRVKRAPPEPRKLPFAQDGQAYATALKMLGNRRFISKTFDDPPVERLTVIPARFTGKQFYVNLNTLVLLNLQDEKADVAYVYSAEETRQLRKLGELPDEDGMFGGDLAEEEEEKEIDFDTI